MKQTMIDRLIDFVDSLAEQGVNAFTHKDVVEALGVTNAQASRVLARYQRSGNGNIGNAVYRQPGTRTANTVYTIGNRSKDVSRIVAQTANDLNTRVDVLAGVMEQIQGNNPHAKRAVGVALMKYSLAHEALMKSLVDAAG